MTRRTPHSSGRTSARTNPRRTPRQARSRATAAAIIEATARVIAKEGYQGATTNRIAEVAGVSIGSLYQYFPSKKALIGALMDDHSAVVRKQLHSAAEQCHGQSLEEAVQTMVRAVLGLNQLDVALKRAMLTEQSTANRTDEVLALENEVQQAMLALLSHYRDELYTADLEMCSFIVTAAVGQTIHAAVIHRPDYLHSEAFVAALCRLVMRYATSAAE